MYALDHKDQAHAQNSVCLTDKEKGLCVWEREGFWKRERRERQRVRDSDRVHKFGSWWGDCLPSLKYRIKLLMQDLGKPQNASK